MAEAVADSQMTVRQIAQKARTSPGQVSQWQTEGRVNVAHVKADVLERIASVLDIRPRWLLYGELPKRQHRADSDGPHARTDVRAVDRDVMRAAVMAVTDGLLAANTTLPPYQMAEVVDLACDMLAESRDSDSARRQVIRLVAIQGGKS